MLRITQLLMLVMIVSACQKSLPADPNKFDFGDEGRASGFTEVKSTNQFSDSTGYGLFSLSEIRSVGSCDLDAITSAQPFYFGMNVPEGNFKVTVIIGNPDSASNTTIKAENRKLMAYDISLEKGEQKQISFLVHVRQPILANGDSVGLNKREFNYPSWDKMLTIEIGGKNAALQSLTIEPVKEDLPVVFLTGNSTVVDQAKEPWGSWGQMFPVFFKDEVIIANHAESGQTMKAFVAGRRLQKIKEQIKSGDYLFMEFAHNDQKPGGNHLDANTTYKEYLMKFANFALERGATPVFVTSTNRRSFDENGQIKNTLEGFPDAMRQLADSTGIAMIDLNAMTKTFYEAMGVEGSKRAFVHYPANTFEDQPEDVADNTHFCSWGAYELAKCVVEGLKKTDLPLKAALKENLPTFDPANPDNPDDWKWPVSPIDEVEEFKELMMAE